jgi:uncharacterized protein
LPGFFVSLQFKILIHLINTSLTYTAPYWLFNKHLETIHPSLFRKVQLLQYKRERIQTSDGDFLDLDWLQQDASHLIVICHGLEGNTSRPYIRGMAKAFYESGFDVLAWNYRGCSGEPNLLARFYNSGATEDLDEVIRHASDKQKYKSISLIGFSLGGNLVLKFLGEDKFESARQIRAAATFSVPVDLYQSCLQISRTENYMYTWYFMKSLRKKIEEKYRLKGSLDISPLKQIKNLIEFDDAYTAPLHGYNNARHYYEMCSALQFMNEIKTPTLLVNALNDPFLSSSCYPEKQLSNHKFVELETPARGGHVGFTDINQKQLFWSEVRALQFIKHQLGI